MSGTIFGGSLFAASDPFYMVMLIRMLGTNMVWDKAAHIRFKKPAKPRVYAVLITTKTWSIKHQVKESGHATKTFVIRWIDKEGCACRD